MRRRRFHPRRLAHTAKARPAAELPWPGRGTGTSWPALLQNRVFSTRTSPGHGYWTEPARDRLAHIGWACAYRLGQAVPGLNHPQIRPWNEWWTADGSPREFCRGPRKSHWASMTSKPLFIMVAESMVMRWPIFQFGCAKACFGVILENLDSGNLRNGPPDAVRTRRRTSARSPPRRHWWMALCSLSTGSSATPLRFTAAMTTSPAATRTSLLASAMCLPSWMAL